MPPEPDQHPLDAEFVDPVSVATGLRTAQAIDLVANALAARRVALALQPIVHSRQPNRVAFREGLLRLMDSVGRIIPARDFALQVESAELGRQLDCSALELGLSMLELNPALRLSVNMSARSIGYRPWTQTLEAALLRSAGAAERLIFEISEASVVQLPEVVLPFMREMQAHGLSFALDNFGAGRSSLRILRDAHFDIVKIDGQYVGGVADRPENQRVIEAAVAMARTFGMLTVATSVERADDAQCLKALGIDCQQGYLHGVPRIPTKRDGTAGRASG